MAPGLHQKFSAELSLELWKIQTPGYDGSTNLPYKSTTTTTSRFCGAQQTIGSLHDRRIRFFSPIRGSAAILDGNPWIKLTASTESSRHYERTPMGKFSYVL